MSKAERIILWIVWAVVAVMAVGVPLAWLAYQQFRTDKTTNLAVVMTPTDLGFLLLMAACVVSLAFWTIRRTRKKSS